MAKYENHYSFSVFDEIKKGRRVYALDKLLAEVYSIHSMEVEDFATLLTRAEADKERYVFWSVGEE